MIRVAPRFLITVLLLSGVTAFGAAAHGPIAPKPAPEISAPALIQEIGRRVGLEPACACNGADAVADGCEPSNKNAKTITCPED